MRAALIFGVLCLTLPAGEKKIQANELPPAVQKAVEEHRKGATLAGLSREREGGVTLYEAEFKIGNRTRDVTPRPAIIGGRATRPR